MEHRLLKRQVRKFLGEDVALTPEMEQFLGAIDATYQQHDADRKLLQRSMDISSTELYEVYEKLLEESDKQSLMLQKLKDSIRALKIGDLDHDLSDEDVLSLVDILEEQIVMRNRVEELLREREEGLRLIIESVKDYAIYALDREGHITSWNHGAERITGYASEEVVGRHFSHFYTMNDLTLGLHQQVFDEAVFAGRSEMQGWRVRKDGTLFWADITLTSLRDEDGTLKGFVKITRDITDRKQAEEALLQAKEAAEQANTAKSEFLANMSHEIRTPMNAVIGMTSLLLDTDLDDEQHDCVETVRTSGEALLSIINDILDFSKIEAGKLTLESQPFDLRGCIEETLDLFASKAAEKEVELIYQADTQTPYTIEGDVTRLRQVLVNLVSNAVKFTSKGEVVLGIHSQMVGTQCRLHFSVRDTGIGIPKDRMNRLFKSFSQVDSSNTRKFGGTGLGLVISKRLVEIMGGSIWVESEKGRGTTFHFTIMVEPIPARKQVEEGRTSWSGKRVLVVDDNETARNILATQLRHWGLRPVTVGSASAALDVMRDDTGFDLALIDVQMPQIDGLALASELRVRPTTAKLPLVLFVSRGDLSLRKEAEKLSDAWILNKPIKQRPFYNALGDVFEPKSRTSHELSRRLNSPLDRTLAEQMPLRILLAEDNLVNQKVALRLLERLGYRADAVANGLEVIEALERQPYDVVLMDVQMPEMDGLEATRSIRNQFDGERQPYIVALTANAMQEDRHACLAAGMDDYVSKPVRIAALIYSLRLANRSVARNGESAS